MTLVKKYFDDGWLKYGNAQITPQGRLNAANRLYADFYHAGIVDLRIPDLAKPRVDGGNNKGTPDYVLDARARFNKAILKLNPEQSFIVWNVVCLDKPIGLQRKAKDYIHNLEVLKEEICKSLDALFCHYWGKPSSPNRHKITSWVDERSREDFEKWIGKLTN